MLDLESRGGYEEKTKQKTNALSPVNHPDAVLPSLIAKSIAVVFGVFCDFVRVFAFISTIIGAFFLPNSMIRKLL